MRSLRTCFVPTRVSQDREVGLLYVTLAAQTTQSFTMLSGHYACQTTFSVAKYWWATLAGPGQYYNTYAFQLLFAVHWRAKVRAAVHTFRFHTFPRFIVTFSPNLEFPPRNQKTSSRREFIAKTPCKALRSRDSQTASQLPASQPKHAEPQSGDTLSDFIVCV